MILEKFAVLPAEKWNFNQQCAKYQEKCTVCCTMFVKSI